MINRSDPPEFEVRTTKGSNHRTDPKTVRTGIEPNQRPASIKSLAQCVLSRSSISNQLSNTPRTEQFEQEVKVRSDIEPEFEGFESNSTANQDLPIDPCPHCNGGHYWLSSSGWRCSDCHPWPAPFQGETCTVPGGQHYRITETTRADLARISPALVGGIPLSAILAQADPANYPDLADPATLAVFAQSLVATGTLNPTQYPDALPKSTAAPERPLVRCGDCQHFQPDTIGNGSGIGRCSAGRKPRHPEAPCYPRIERSCAAWRAKP